MDWLGIRITLRNSPCIAIFGGWDLLLRPAAASNDCFWEALLTRLRYDDRGLWAKWAKIDFSSFSAVILHNPWVIQSIHKIVSLWKTMVETGMKHGVTLAWVECIPCMEGWQDLAKSGPDENTAGRFPFAPGSPGRGRWFNCQTATERG
jgi:hypothetical protein